MKNKIRPNFINNSFGILLFICFQLISCNTFINKEEKITKSDLSDSERFLVEFSENNKEGSNNSISQELTNNKFKKEFTNQLKKSNASLSFIELELSDVFIYKGSHYGHFNNHNNYQKKVNFYGNKSKIFKINVDVICKLNIPEEDVLKMKKGSKYKIIGDFIGFANIIEILEENYLSIWSAFTDVKIGKYSTIFDLGVLELSSKNLIVLPSI